METRKATFAAGCFWGVEASFKKLEGVVSTRVGYTGGHSDDPSYKDVCSHKTGHAEAVELIYDPSQISYIVLLEHFWTIHNPTTLNRQGYDIGSQYRSAIYYHDDDQQQQALQLKEELDNSGQFKKLIVTEISNIQTFWEAEEYHQNYHEKNNSSCQL